MIFRHECGGTINCSGKAVVGWNICICSRCGEVFYKWFTLKMVQM